MPLCFGNCYQFRQQFEIDVVVAAVELLYSHGQTHMVHNLCDISVERALAENRVQNFSIKINITKHSLYSLQTNKVPDQVFDSVTKFTICG